jgi:protein-L-isoaspartate(D-aspartate) O-methyltransferase
MKPGSAGNTPAPPRMPAHSKTHTQNKPMQRSSLLLLFFMMGFTCPSVLIAQQENDFSRMREEMVQDQIVARGVKDKKVINAMNKVKRHLFVPEKYRAFSYRDHPLPIGEGQTISQPYIVAYMTEVLNLRPGDRILEVGTGSGYQAAILAELVKEVYTIEIIGELGRRARKILDTLGYKNIQVIIGDGYKGWPEKAPYDAVIVTCAPERIPEALVRQLKEGGRMIIPVGKAGGIQKLVKCVKMKGVIKTEDVMHVRFVPMVKGCP